MKLAIVSDIHGNLSALEAVLADIERRNVDLTVNLGDLVSGPLQPGETAARLMDLNLPTIRGNHERQLLDHPPESLGASDSFARNQLRPDQLEWLSTFPATLSLSEAIFLCHGTPQSDLDYLLESVDPAVVPIGCRQATNSEVAERIRPVSVPLILCGHTHIPRLVRLDNGTIILNPGSVGIQAYKAEWPTPHIVEAGSPHARYAIAGLHGENSSSWTFEHFEIEYDWEAAARLAESNGRPDWAVALRTGKA